MMGSKVGSIAINGTDNILISSFIGLSIVGIYSNYALIFTSVTSILNQFINAVSSSIGNFVFSKDVSKINLIYKRHDYVNFVVTMYATVMLITLINPFISLWIGDNFKLSDTIVVLLGINFMLNQLRQTNITFISAYGLYGKVGMKSVFEAILNLGISLVMIIIFNFGIVGIIGANIFSNLLINVWYEPFIVYKYGIKSYGLSTYFLKYFTKCVQIVIISLISLWASRFITTIGLSEFIFLFVAVTIFVTIMIFLLTRCSNEYSYFKFFLIRKIGKIK